MIIDVDFNRYGLVFHLGKDYPIFQTPELFSLNNLDLNEFGQINRQ